MKGVGGVWVFAICAICAVFAAAVAVAGDLPGDAGRGLIERDRQVSLQLRPELARLFPGARVEIVDSPTWTDGLAGQIRGGKVDEVTLIDENGRGQASFSARIETSAGAVTASGEVGFAAFLPARVATRRILPGEALLPELFTSREVNIASGEGREYRGLILPSSAAIGGLEARQTIVAGQFLVSSAIERIPDVRRGDSVRIHLVSGGLTLSAAGVAEEPAYLDGRVRVMSSGTKRELVGTLLNGGVVEVRL